MITPLKDTSQNICYDLCGNCCATVPGDTSMLYCESCKIHVCGSCFFISSSDHSNKYSDTLRYMIKYEKHLQYVPDSIDTTQTSDQLIK